LAQAFRLFQRKILPMSAQQRWIEVPLEAIDAEVAAVPG
jgi:hypothetical protein